MPREMTDSEKEVVKHALQEVYGDLATQRHSSSTYARAAVAALVNEKKRMSESGITQYGPMTPREFEHFVDEVEAGEVALVF